MKWKRVRPGLYRLESGNFRAEVERGAEVKRWWWAVWLDELCAPDDAGVAGTLHEAQLYVRETWGWG